MKNNFTPEQIAEIKEIVENLVRDNYLSGNPTIDPHSHNGTDNLNINPVDLIGWTPLPTNTQQYLNEVTGLQEYGFASPQQLAGGDSSHLGQYVVNTNLAQYPIPIIIGNGVGTQSQFEGGYAPEGTLVFFNNGTTLSGLYIRVDGIWRGVNFNLTA